MSLLGRENQSTPQGAPQHDSGFGSIGHVLNRPESGSFEGGYQHDDESDSACLSLLDPPQQLISLAIDNDSEREPQTGIGTDNLRRQTDINSDVSSPDSTTTVLGGATGNSVTNQTSNVSSTISSTTNIHEVGDLEETGIPHNFDTNGLTTRLDEDLAKSRRQSSQENSIASDDDNIPAQNPANLTHRDTSPAPLSREDTPSPVLSTVSSIRAQPATVWTLEIPIRTPVVESHPDLISERLLVERA